jgi:hypothetical protein
MIGQNQVTLLQWLQYAPLHYIYEISLVGIDEIHLPDDRIEIQPGRGKIVIEEEPPIKYLSRWWEFI